MGMLLVALCAAAALQSSHTVLQNSKKGPAAELLHTSLQPAASLWQSGKARLSLLWKQANLGAGVIEGVEDSLKSDGTESLHPANASHAAICSCKVSHQAASADACCWSQGQHLPGGAFKARV